MSRLGVIGSGSRAAGVVGTMRAIDPEVSVVAVADPDETRARERLTRAKVPHEGARFAASAEALLERAEGLDGIVIGTRCDLHTEMAVKAAQAGLPVFLEKPVAIAHEQIADLKRAYEGREDSV